MTLFVYLSRVSATLVLPFVLALCSAQTWAEPLAVGKGDFQFRDEQGDASKVLTVWYYRPAALRADSKVVFVMHGVERNGETYRDHWSRYAEQHGFLLLAPEFSRRDFPRDAYQFGNVKEPNVAKWSFSTIEHLFDAVKVRESLTAERYFLYGHSAGAQFVHRFMLFMPAPRAALAISANAGSYTLPIYASSPVQPRFPWSLDKAIVSEEGLKSAFSRKLLVLLGEQDIDPNHAQLTKEPEAMAQGAFRFARGQYFFQVAKDQANKMAVPLGWSLSTVPGVAHSNSGMAKAAVRFIVDAPQ